MEDIQDYFVHIIEQAHSYDIAESEFKRAIAEDDSLHMQYREWCRERGTTEKHGFMDFCEEYMADRNEVWETLNDYDDEE
ncbi:MAG: hypothetical protein NC406_02620 [Bacteroides sp.]|nr:hypothetical protein [Bacteroides sp.]MCM1094892.1 hypothetical protein [Terasakiella sp.]